MTKNIDIRADFGYAIPTVHMNGSPKESLIGEWMLFKQALEEVHKYFPSESFHGRHHYVKGDDGHDNSEAYAQALMDHLNTAICSVEEIIVGIEEQ